MKPLFNMLAATALIFFGTTALAQETIDYSFQQCRVVDQSGSIDSWACRKSDGKIRCYADIELEGGAKTRVWGGCASTYSDCWAFGDSRVDACN